MSTSRLVCHSVGIRPPYGYHTNGVLLERTDFYEMTSVKRTDSFGMTKGAGQPIER